MPDPNTGRALRDRFHQLRGDSFNQIANLDPGTGAVRSAHGQKIISDFLASRNVPDTEQNRATAFEYLTGGQLGMLDSASTTESDIASQALMEENGGSNAAPAAQSPQNAPPQLQAPIPLPEDIQVEPLDDPASAPIDMQELRDNGIAGDDNSGSGSGIAKWLAGLAAAGGAVALAARPQRAGKVAENITGIGDDVPYRSQRPEALSPQDGASTNTQGEFVSQRPSAEAARADAAMPPPVYKSSRTVQAGPEFQSNRPSAQAARAGGIEPQRIPATQARNSIDMSQPPQEVSGHTRMWKAANGNGFYLVNEASGEALHYPGDIAAMAQRDPQGVERMVQIGVESLQ